LVCKRVTESAAKSEIQNREIRSKLKGSSAPDIDAGAWLNTEAPLGWKDLRGKVVLLDFWGTWCQPCVEKLPHAEALYQKYKDRGLVVLGVHSKDGAENVAAFLQDKRIHFPVVVDGGETAKRYAVESWPTYFLVDQTGQVVWGFENDAPDEQRIEDLLPKR
jgi:thiol-disulfide isomerase/thioredoxin